MFSLVWLHLGRKKVLCWEHTRGRELLHPNPHHMNVAAQNIIQGQMLPHCSGYLELNLCKFCCSLSHLMDFRWKFNSLISVSVMFPDRCLRKLQWACLEVLGSGCHWRIGFGGHWTWTVCLFSASKECLFCMVSASRCLDCVICQLIFMFRKKSTKQNPNK